jgi:hypothetical protein
MGLATLGLVQQRLQGLRMQESLGLSRQQGKEPLQMLQQRGTMWMLLA